ncbi:hypothetical protein [Nocardia rosealba]|uniref:hypothetical protein n=1 Tax=Nocardia rosealba TaxID=2878563 RepID=UPI001CDA0F1C|nr:hypothetical protein [Nocardia rosealba]MCA2207968.1 hypothetical protein [Nocardia rosealba]
MDGGRARDGVGRARFVAVGVVVAGWGRVVVVVGGAAVVELGGTVVRGVVVVVVGAAVVVVVDVTVTVGGSAVTVTVLGLTVEVSGGIAVTGTVDSGTDATPGSCGGGVACTERLAVTDKLTLTEVSGESAGKGSVVTMVVVSGAGAVLGGSVSGWSNPASVAGSVPEATSGTATSLGASATEPESTTAGLSSTAQ